MSASAAFKDPAEFSVPWAVRLDGGGVVHLADYIRARERQHIEGVEPEKEALGCGYCKQPVHYRKPAVNGRAPHFAHNGKGGGGCTMMSAAHRIFRDAAAELLVEYGARNSLFDRPPWQGAQPKGAVVTEGAILDSGLRADVWFTPHDARLAPAALEIVVAKGVERRKRHACADRGVVLAVARIERDTIDFEKCDTERDMLELAKSRLRGAGLFKLISEPTYRTETADVIVLRPTQARFACEPAMPPPLWPEPAAEASPPVAPPVAQPPADPFPEWPVRPAPAPRPALQLQPEPPAQRRPEPYSVDDPRNHWCEACAAMGRREWGSFGSTVDGKTVWRCGPHKTGKGSLDA